MTFYTALNTSYQKTSEDHSMNGEVQLRKNSSALSMNGKAPSTPFDVETIIKVGKSQKFFFSFLPHLKIRVRNHFLSVWENLMDSDFVPFLWLGARKNELEEL